MNIGGGGAENRKTEKLSLHNYELLQFSLCLNRKPVKYRLCGARKTLILYLRTWASDLNNNNKGQTV